MLRMAKEAGGRGSWSNLKSPQREPTMHIVWICHEYPPTAAGIGVFTQTLAHKLVQLGHSCSVVGVYPDEETSETCDKDVRVVRIGGSRFPKLAALINARRINSLLARLDAEHPIDILEGPDATLALVPRSLNVTTVLRMHGGHRYFASTTGESPRLINSYLERRAFRRADHLCAVSRYTAEANKLLLSIPERPVTVLYNPVDITPFCGSENANVDYNRLFFFGTLVRKKGVLQLIQAFQLIADKHPNLELWLAGKPWRDRATGEWFDEILKRELREPYESRVRFLGPVPHPDIPMLLATSGLVCLPSIMEAHPIAWLEAMAAGRPLIASDVGPAREIIRSGENGLLCDPFSPTHIADQIDWALTNREATEELGKAARAWVTEHLSLDMSAQLNEDFYGRCASTQESFLNEEPEDRTPPREKA